MSDKKATRKLRAILSVDVKGCPGVQGAAVVSMPHSKMVEVPKAVIALKPGVEVSAEDIVNFLEARLATFKIPHTIDFQDELPKSGSDKVLRRVIRDA